MKAEEYGPWPVAGCELRIDFSPKVQLVATRAGELLRGLPPEVRASGEMAWIRLALQAAAEHRRVLKQLLEDAMVQEIPLGSGDLALLASDPAGAPMLAGLLVEAGGVVGLPHAAEGGLETLAGAGEPLAAPFLVPHPARLAAAGTLAEWKRWQSARWLRQPFKQLHRELFLRDEHEPPTAASTSRFGGCRVRWDQARALLEGRGWYRVTGTGAERIYERAGLTAYLEYRPTSGPLSPGATVLLHRIYFLPTGERAGSQANPGLPLVDVPAIVYSETLRDAGLVAEVAGR